jgi:hypothetical protein
MQRAARLAAHLVAGEDDLVKTEIRGERKRSVVSSDGPGADCMPLPVAQVAWEL